MKSIKKLVLGIALAGAIATRIHADTKPFGKIAGYYDTRGEPTGTLTLGASDLPLNTKFFSFMDFGTEKNNLKSLYGEYRLSKKSDSGFGIAVEHNHDFSKSGTTRIGFVFEPKFKRLLPNTFLGAKFYPASSHNHGMQLGIYGNVGLLNGNLTFDGFFDYNFKPDKIVTDIQLGYRLKNNLYGVVEGRYNGFSSRNKRLGAGLGLEWKL